MNMGQGGVINGRYLYLPVGLQNNAEGQRKDAERAIIIIDLKKHKIKKIIDLNNVIFDEPEDVDFYKGNLNEFDRYSARMSDDSERCTSVLCGSSN